MLVKDILLSKGLSSLSSCISSSFSQMSAVSETNSQPWYPNHSVAVPEVLQRMTVNMCKQNYLTDSYGMSSLKVTELFFYYTFN